jgi:TonB family protein
MKRFTAMVVALGLLGGCATASRPETKSAQVPVLVAASIVPDSEAGADDPYALGLSAAVPLYSPQPAYPEQERLAGVEAKVEVRYEVSKEGRVVAARAFGPEAFRQKALEALARWRFQPATRDGIPLRSRRTTEFAFRVKV